MNNLVSRLLEAIAAREASAEKDSSSTHTRYRIGGTYSGRRHVNVERRDGILRHCAADRRLIAIHEKGENALGEPVCLCCARDTFDGDREGEWPCETLLTRFEAYGLEVTE